MRQGAYTFGDNGRWSRGPRISNQLFQSPLEIFMRIEDFILLIQEMYGVNAGGNILYHVVSIIAMIGVFLAIFYQFIKVIQGKITNNSLLL